MLHSEALTYFTTIIISFLIQTFKLKNHCLINFWLLTIERFIFGKQLVQEARAQNFENFIFQLFNSPVVISLKFRMSSVSDRLRLFLNRSSKYSCSDRSPDSIIFASALSVQINDAFRAETGTLLQRGRQIHCTMKTTHSRLTQVSQWTMQKEFSEQSCGTQSTSFTNINITSSAVPYVWKNMFLQNYRKNYSRKRWRGRHGWSITCQLKHYCVGSWRSRGRKRYDLIQSNVRWVNKWVSSTSLRIGYSWQPCIIHVSILNQI